MLIVAERINASRAPIRAALETRDAAFVREEARRQAEAGADYIDVNGGTFPGREAELLSWLVEVVQDATPVPLCLDSSDPDALASALERVTGAAVMINSITLERDRCDRVLALALERKAKLIALCQGEDRMGQGVEERIGVASRLVDRLTGAGMAPGDIYVDPMVFPVAAEATAGRATLEVVRAVMARYPGVHAICGLTNVSHGLPARPLLNRTFLVAAVAHGLDAAIVDPTDGRLMAALASAETVMGRDEFCMGYIAAFREGRLE